MAQAGANFTGAAAGGDLSGTYPNPAVAKVGGQTAANVASGAVLANAATNLNTTSTIVRRDASGNFSAGTVTLAGALALPATASSSVGVITLGGSPFVHNFGLANTFLGESAGNFTMTGNSNTAVGNTAMINNSTGSRNTASGYGALFSNTSGASNTAFGAGALASNAGGQSNTAVGDRALQINTGVGSGYNTASGASALSSNTSGFSNTANGAGALLNNTTGSGNIAIGAGAGLNLTTGNNNIDIDSGGVAAESSTIRIGNSSFQMRASVADIFYLINFLFTGGPPPVALAGGGFTWQGAWSNTTTYAVNDVVSFNGSSYISITASNLAISPIPVPRTGTSWRRLGRTSPAPRRGAI